jgi:hypothetical protein
VAANRKRFIFLFLQFSVPASYVNIDPCLVMKMHTIPL